MVAHGHHEHILIDTELDESSVLDASIITTPNTMTTDEMPESYLVSSRDESFLEYSSADELKESRYQVESIVLDDDESDAQDVDSPLSQI